MNDDTQSFSFTQDPSSLTKILKVFLWISVGVGALAVVSDIAQSTLLTGGPVGLAEANANDARQGLVGIISIITFIITGITFLRWVYRANVNCHGFGAQNMQFTPGWAVGFYFVPILSFFKPCEAMVEIWKISQDPMNWENQSNDALVGVWWSLFLVSNIAGNISIQTALRAKDPETLTLSTVAAIISTIAGIALDIVAVSLVSKILKMQQKLVNRYSH